MSDAVDKARALDLDGIEARIEDEGSPTLAQSRALLAEIRRLRAGGCARDQRLTQHCAEAAALDVEVARLRTALATAEGERDTIAKNADRTFCDACERLDRHEAPGITISERIDGLARQRDAAQRLGAEAERARIVTWLREDGWSDESVLHEIADDIERGEHINTTPAPGPSAGRVTREKE